MRKKTEINDTDKAIFREAVRHVKPLVHTKIKPPSSTPQRPAPKKRDVYEESGAPFSDYEALESVSGDELLAFNRPGIQHKILRKLREGQYNIEARLDLHGMTSEEASTALHQFLLRCQEQGLRHVLIIHGKGTNSGKPILKNKLNHWLRQTELVLAFCSATHKDGRGGALYALLKKGAHNLTKKTIIIGIAGASASGKSLLANTIVNELGSAQVVVISEDSYYKDHSNTPFEERTKINYDHPDALDHELLFDHLTQLQQGQAIQVPTYSHAKHTREQETRSIGQHTIIVLEGILLFSDQKLRKLMDIRIFMETALDICLIRRLKRDMKERGRLLDAVLKQYEETVRPMYLQFIEPSKRYADIIVPRGGGNRIAIDMIKAKMRELLGNMQL